MFRFAHPEYFQFLWLLPVLFLLTWYFLRHRMRRIESAFGSKLTPFLTATRSDKRRYLKLGLQLVVVAVAVIALARPQFGTSTQKVASQGVELIIAFDVSESMLAEDVRPSRLEFAKSEIKRLIDKMTGNKIGILPFAGTAVLVSPLTSDASALKMYVDSLSPYTVSSQGTEFRKALEESKEAFQRGGIDKDEFTQVTRVILLVSDGEDHEPGAIPIAEDLSKEGVRIFSLAFGTEKGAPIPLRDDRGYLKGYKKDKAGNKVLSATKGTVLKELAKVGRGSFYHASFGGRAINNIRDDIDKLEKTEFDSEVATDYDERFQVPLAMAILLALIELFLSDRRQGGKFWRGRFEVKA